MTDRVKSSILRAEDVSCVFGSGPNKTVALRDINLSLRAGECLGIVGESGSGKSTLGRILVGLQQPTQGRVLFKERPLKRAGAGGRLQMVFQDSSHSLNPRQTIVQSLIEPLLLQGTRRRQARQRAAFWIERVGLRSDHLQCRPDELSGGQKQRIGIARAFIGDPELVVCDEAVSALDVSVQAQILRLLQQLQRDTGISMVFIAHDLPLVQALCSRTMVLYGGDCQEEVQGGELFDAARHPYTRDLIMATPSLDPRQRRLSGALQSSLQMADTGCRYRLRCQQVSERCQRLPTLESTAGGHIRCWHPH